MSDLIIKIQKATRKVELEQLYIGNDHENLQENLVFQFDEFVDGQARLEYELNGNLNYIILTKQEETYTLPVQNVITVYQEETAGKIKFQLVISEGTNQENIPVFKSNIFYLRCRPSINAVTEAPEGYELWIEQANAKLNAMDEALTEVNNLDIDVSKTGKVVTIDITKKDGTQKQEEVRDGYDIEYDWQGTSLGVKLENEQEYEYVDLKGDRGDSYVITPQDYNAIAGIVETNIQPTLTNIQNTANNANGTANTAKETADTASGVASSANTTANTAKSIAEGATQALSYSNYSTMITAFNALPSTTYRVGQNIYINTLEVPDLWISSIESSSSTYTYTTDEAFISALETNGYVQVGYYKLSALETQKVDLTNYATKDEFVTLTQAQYDNLQTINPDVYYYIIEE